MKSQVHFVKGFSIPDYEQILNKQNNSFLHYPFHNEERSSPLVEKKKVEEKDDWRNWTAALHCNCVRSKFEKCFIPQCNIVVDLA